MCTFRQRGVRGCVRGGMPSSRWLRGRLPGELRDLVGRHAAAIELQRVARGAMARRALSYTRGADWPALRGALREAGRGVGLSPNAVAELAAYDGVTLEWRLEAASWLSTLRSPQGPEILRVILQECRNGDWS